MALQINWLERIERESGLSAIESISLLYNVITTALILILYANLDHPTLMLYERLGIASLTITLVFLYTIVPCKLTAFLRIATQMGLLAYWYPDTYEFNRLFPNMDHYFAQAEQWLFGCQPAVEFSQHFSNLWISEALHMGYFFYYPMIFIVTVYYFFKRYDQFEKVGFLFVTSFFIYYAFYILIPVAGPQFYFPAIGMDQVLAGHFPAIGDYFYSNNSLLPGPGDSHGFFYQLVETSQQVGERPTAAFPSSHVGVSTIAMCLAWKASKRLWVLLFPFYALLCGATVYIQAHYLIDALAGFCTAFLVLWISSQLYQRQAVFSIIHIFPALQGAGIKKVFSYILIFISMKK